MKQHTRRLVKIRPHPKSRTGPVPATTLDQDLDSAFAVVIWSSGVGTKALLDGIPVFYCAPHYFLEDAADNYLVNVAAPSKPDRLPAFEKFAWGANLAATLQFSAPVVVRGVAPVADPMGQFVLCCAGLRGLQVVQWSDVPG